MTSSRSLQGAHQVGGEASGTVSCKRSAQAGGRVSGQGTEMVEVRACRVPLATPCHSCSYYPCTHVCKASLVLPNLRCTLNHLHPDLRADTLASTARARSHAPRTPVPLLPSQAVRSAVRTLCSQTPMQPGRWGGACQGETQHGPNAPHPNPPTHQTNQSTTLSFQNSAAAPCGGVCTQPLPHLTVTASEPLEMSARHCRQPPLAAGDA